MPPIISEEDPEILKGEGEEFLFQLEWGAVPLFLYIHYVYM
jgi:hypothetical protein